MKIKLSPEKIKILKEEGTHFRDSIDEKTYYQYPQQVYKETENESIFELVDKIITPIELPSDEDIYSILRGKKMFEKDWGFIEGAKWMREQILKQNK